jgi:hypothetical protein
VLDDFSAAIPSLRFAIELENNNRINFLDITIKKVKEKLYCEIYRKPTSTDNHPTRLLPPGQQKLSAIRYLQHRNNTYPKSTANKKNIVAFGQFNSLIP